MTPIDIGLTFGLLAQTWMIVYLCLHLISKSEQNSANQEDLRIAQGALTSEQKSREVEKVSYETRLGALQVEVYELKRRLLNPNGSNHVDTRLSEKSGSSD